MDGLNCRCSAGSRTEGHGRGCGIRWLRDHLASGRLQWRASSEQAAEFGTQGINFRARKAADAQEWLAAKASLACEVLALLGSDAGDTGESES